jgi:hypothetical protein
VLGLEGELERRLLGEVVPLPETVEQVEAETPAAAPPR